jgi:nitroreductase
MEAYEAILTRRSVRAYTDQPVSDEMIHKLLVAAMSAPSAGNGQPWHFGVITERIVLNSLAELLPFGKMLQQAPLAIVVCGETKGQPFDGYWVQDCSAATENLLLAAHALGLGGVWLGVYPREDRVAGVRNILGMADAVTPLCVLSIGHPAEPSGPVDRYRAERVHRDRW